MEQGGDDDDSRRTRILRATATVLARMGPTRLNMSEVATTAKVSRPTLYRYFPSKEVLLDALGQYEQERVHEAVAAAVDGLSGRERLEALLRYMVESHNSYPLRNLILIEPEHELGEIERVLPVVQQWIEPEFEGPAGHTIAGAIARIAICHYLFPEDDDGRSFLAQLRRVAGLDT
ncbi:UNVERIFIED_CONTAM: TetR family transcriptional regulator [Williamsia faeni]